MTQLSTWEICVSVVLLFRKTECNENPVIPLAFYLHEQKLLSTHNEFIRQMKAFRSRQSHECIHGDGQQGQHHLSHVHLKTFLCWNHVMQATMGVLFVQIPLLTMEVVTV